MTELSFTTVERPAVTRSSGKANPFVELAKTLADDRAKTLGFSVELPADGDADKLTASVKRQLADAAEPHCVTLRTVTTVTEPKGKVAGSIAFSVWAVDKIVRKTKTK